MKRKSNNRSRRYRGGGSNIITSTNIATAPATIPAIATAPATIPATVNVPSTAPSTSPLESGSISHTSNELVKQALSPTPEPAVQGEPIIIKLGSQVIPVKEEEIALYIKTKEDERLKKIRDEYLAIKKQKTFLESLKNGTRSGSALCLGFAMVFMMEFNLFLKTNKDNFCKSPKEVYRDLLTKIINNLESYVVPSGPIRTVLDTLIKQANVISIILTIFSFPLLPLCATGNMNIIIDVITVVIGVIAEKLCTEKRIEIKHTIKDIFHKIRNTKLSNLYPGATIKMMGAKLKNLRNRTRRTFSKEGIQEFSTAVKSKAQSFKNRVSGMRNKVSSLFRRKQQPPPNLATAPAIGGRRTRKNFNF